MWGKEKMTGKEFILRHDKRNAPLKDKGTWAGGNEKLAIYSKESV